MTATDIANLALSHLGARQLAAGTLATDTTQQGISANLWFAPARLEALRSHPWNFATARERLTTVYTLYGGADLINFGGLIQVPQAAHGLTTGQRIYFKDILGTINANGRWYVTVLDDDNFVLDDSVFSGTYTLGSGSYVIVPNDGWQFQFAISRLSNACLRVMKINGNDGNDKTDSSDHQIENGYILTDCEKPHIHYVFDQTNYTAWAPDFITAFSYLLASYIAQNITGPAGKAGELRQAYEQTFLPKARSRDAREARARRVLPFDDSQAIQARYGGRDPLGTSNYGI